MKQGYGIVNVGESNDRLFVVTNIGGTNSRTISTFIGGADEF